MRRVLRHWVDRLLGERCVCGERVFPRDVPAHEALEHAGDQPTRREACWSLKPLGRGFVLPVGCYLDRGHDGPHRGGDGSEWLSTLAPGA